MRRPGFTTISRTNSTPPDRWVNPRASRPFLRPCRCLLTALVAAAATTSSAAVTGIGPLPYLSAADSPFVGNPTLVTVLEDFEDGLLNVPGIVNDPIPDVHLPPLPVDGRGIINGPGLQTDSVDGDDGAIDGSGTGGHSLRSTALSDLVLDGNDYVTLAFHFEPKSNGQYPTAFGFVWTDGQPASHVRLIVLGAVRLPRRSSSLTTLSAIWPTMAARRRIVFSESTVPWESKGFLFSLIMRSRRRAALDGSFSKSIISSSAMRFPSLRQPMHGGQ